MTIQESVTLIQALKDPSLYNHSVTPIQILETHISWVILTGPFAYKIKKPVDLGFVDFSTLEKRHFYCLEEVRLNKRLAPELYLGVVPISGSPEHPILHSAEQPIEYAVHMRQFPLDATLDEVVARGELELKHFDQLAIDIARFHETVAVADAGSPFGSPQMIYKTVEEVIERFSLGAGLPVSPASYQDVFDWVSQEQVSLEGRFAARKDQGYVRECHGDMHLANLVLLHGHVVPFDGIEFSERLRWIDVMSDLAFPVMDCIARDRSDGAHRLLNKYFEQTGDYEGLEVFRYYQVYRALVRAKVANIRLNQFQHDQKKRTVLAEQFHHYLTVARQSLQSRSSGIVLMHGVSGSGKTTISQALLESIGAIRVRSDVERKRLFGMESTTGSMAERQDKLYGRQATETTYQRLYDLAGIIAKAEYPVIVDATFLQERFRRRFRTLAEERRIPFVIVDTFASPSALVERVRSRFSQGQDASDADVQVMFKQEGSQDPLTKSEKSYVIRVNSEEVFKPKVILDVLSRQ